MPGRGRRGRGRDLVDRVALRRGLGVAGPLVFIASWIVAGALRDGYDPATDAISRLAELDAPRRWLVTTGMLAFATGAIAAAPLLSRRASVALTLAGIGSASVAAFPCTPGCPGAGTTTDTGHVLAASLHYAAFAAVPALHRRSAREVAISVVAGSCLGLQALGLGPNGLMQRAGLTILDLWLVATLVTMHAPRLGSRRVLAP